MTCVNKNFGNIDIIHKLNKYLLKHFERQNFKQFYLLVNVFRSPKKNSISNNEILATIAPFLFA
jgi:hypothetical protein